MSERVTVVQAARSRDLVELATVKSVLEITDSSKDARISTSIRAASELLATDTPGALGRPPWRQKYQEDRPGAGGLALRLSRHPAETLVSLTHDGATVDGALIHGIYRDHLYLEDGFEDDRVFAGQYIAQQTTEGEPLYRITYYAGWLMPGEAVAWAAGAAKALGALVKATTYQFGDLFFETTTAGTTGSTQPTWPTTESGTVTDGTVTWTARAAVELPASLQEAALALAIGIFRSGFYSVPAGIVEEQGAGGRRIRYASGESGVAAMAIPPQVAAVVSAYA